MEYGGSHGEIPSALDGSLARFEDNIVWFPVGAFSPPCLFNLMNCGTIYSLEVQLKKTNYI